MLLGLHRPIPLRSGSSSRQGRRTAPLSTVCTMSEENYNNRWLKLWADGLKPGDVGAGTLIHVDITIRIGCLQGVVLYFLR